MVNFDAMKMFKRVDDECKEKKLLNKVVYNEK